MKRLCALGAVALFLIVATSASAAQYAPDTVIVKLRAGAAAGALLDRSGVTAKVGSIRGVSASVYRVKGDPAAVAARLSGTSMATPHAAAVAGVLRQLFPGDTAQGIRNRLTAAVNDLGAPGRDTSFGFGRVNLCKAPGGGC